MEYIRETYMEYCSQELHNRSSIERKEASAGKFFDQALAEHDDDLRNQTIQKVQDLLIQKAGDAKELSIADINAVLNELYTS